MFGVKAKVCREPGSGFIIDPTVSQWYGEPTGPESQGGADCLAGKPRKASDWLVEQDMADAYLAGWDRVNAILALPFETQKTEWARKLDDPEAVRNTCGK